MRVARIECNGGVAVDELLSLVTNRTMLVSPDDAGSQGFAGSVAVALNATGRECPRK